MKNTREVTFTYLKILNKKIKSKSLKKQQRALNTLKVLHIEDIGLLVYSKYLEGKFHYLNYRRDNNLTSLKMAAACYHDVFVLGRQHRIHIKNPKYFFKYAETLHILSQYVFCLFEQNEMHNKAYKIAIHSSRRNPDNTSMKWLQGHILSS